jgi:YidC/Oxa1 family membrane protein insertase
MQMPILFALFATLRGSPFSDVNYNVNVQVLPREQSEQVQPQAFVTSPQNIYVADGVHAPVSAVLPGGNHLAVGEKTNIGFQTSTGEPLTQLLAEHPETDIKPHWQVTKGENLVRFDENGNLEALAPGDVTLQGTVPGLASDKGFLFIKALGRVGAFGEDGSINWDILGMVLFFGISLYINQLLSGQGPNANANPQQAAVNRFTPIIFSGMFLFFPLPAGVLMYMVIANIFQTAQSYILSKEPLPENLQKIVDEEEKKLEGRETLPFEPGKSKKEESAKAEVKPEAKPPKSLTKPAAKSASKQSSKQEPKPAVKQSSTKDSSAKDGGNKNKG